MKERSSTSLSGRVSYSNCGAIQLAFLIFFGFTYLYAPAGDAAQVSIPYTSQQLRDRVFSEVAPGIDLARASKKDSYILWRPSTRPTYKIISSQLFYYGIFYSYLASLSNATDVDFRLVGDRDIQPNVLVVMDYKIDSWDQVSRFLESREETGFQEKLAAARAGRFTGCTVDLQYKDGITHGALIVVNIAHEASDVRKCLYKTAFQLFGLYPVDNDKAMGLDLIVVSALYRLTGEQLTSKNIDSALNDQLGLR